MPATYINEWNIIHIGRFAVVRYNILGTNVVVYNAYELDIPVPGEYHNHTTLQHIDSNHVWYGTLTSRMLPREIADMSVGPERFRMVDAFRYKNEQDAYDLIMQAFPHTRFMWDSKRDGVIEINSHPIASFVRHGTEFKHD